MRYFLAVFVSLAMTLLCGASWRVESRQVVSPDPDSLAVSTRLYGVSGASVDTSVYFRQLKPGGREREWAIDQQNDRGALTDSRWYWSPDATVSGETVTVYVLDEQTTDTLDSGTYSLSTVSNTAAAGASIVGLTIGDSVCDAPAEWQARVLALSTANTSGSQVTWTGTLGTGSNKHEGRAGWRSVEYYQPSEDAWGGGSFRTENPFVNLAGDKFDASFYLTDTGLPAPDFVLWALGINDMSTAQDDASAVLGADAYISNLKEMIGVTVAGDVGSWIEVSSGIEHLIAVPLSPASSRDDFALSFGVTINRARYLRNIHILQERIVSEFGSLEGSGIFLLPWNVSVSPASYDDGIHPSSGGFDELGNVTWAAINVLQVGGLIGP